ncbi:MAG: DUF637 domain-containing protein, partial [Endozoicomonadaceae bacterium]|nr:DUF637 domain-containing protein [Endozoicomonadaceae bacterium]
EIYIEKPSENSKEQENLKKNTLPDSIFSFFKPFVKSLKKFIPSYFLASENIELSANEGVHVQVKSHNQSLQDSIDLVQQQDGLQWIAQLRDNPDVEWEPIEEAHKHWKHKAQGLTPEAAALISIAAGIATCGIATEIEAAIGGIAGTMNSAGFTSLVGTASVSAINNQGDVGKVLQELGQSKNVKRIVNSMLTAGLLKQVDQYLPDAKHGADPGDRFKATLAKSFAHAGVSATMNTATIGGDFTDNLQDALKSNLLNQLHQQICTSIGNHFEFHQEDFNKTLTHALAGGVKAKLEGDEFATGALAAALAELSGDTLINHIDDEQRRKKIAGLISATAIMLAGGDAKDIEHANEIAETVHQYNATFHANQAKALQEIIKDKTEEEKSRFLAAGFYLRRVINGVPEDDEYYEQLKALYDRGAECCEEQETLKRTELFDYSSLDAVADWCDRNDEAIHRATGLVKMIYGGTTAGTSVAGGFALSGASLGSAAVFTPLYAMGAKAGTEEVKEGFQQATEEFHSNKGKAVFDSFDNPQDFDWYSAAGRAAVEVILDVTTKQLGGTVVKAGIKQIDKAVDQTKKGAKNLSDTLKSGKKGDVSACEGTPTSIGKIDKPSSVNSSSKNLYGPYNPKETRKDLEEIHG